MPLSVTPRVLVVALVGAACAANGEPARLRVERYDRSQIEESLERGDAGIVIGVFPLSKGAVVDADTIKVGGLDATLRLIGLDSEETFKYESDRRLYETGWQAYLESKQAATSGPIKVATPMGDEAKRWAQAFFHGVQRVRLERDDAGEIRDRFDRYLAYVFLEKDGEWVNYNVEAVRAGMSPYFAKYGYSRRFHREFVAAQDEARAAERGIWDPAKQHYLDYEQRLTWWNARARFIARFERDGAGRDDMIDLTDWDAMRRLEQMEGEEVVVLATVGEVYRSDRVTRVMLSRRRGEDLPLVFFDARVLERSGIERHSGEYVRVSGVVAKYRSRRKRGAPREQLQIVVNVPRQVTVPDYQRPRGSVAPEATAGPAEPALEAPREP